MNPDSSSTPPGARLSSFLDRRGFLRSGAAAGVGLVLTSKSAIGQEATKTLNVALAGCGAQGERLRDAMNQIEGIRITALCDIWEYNRQGMARRLNAYKKPIDAQYSDFAEMLDKETNLDAVIICVPDWLHHTFTRMALEKGIAVYCEKMMTNTIERARDMVKAQRETGGVLQVGHQRHSNPRYIHLKNNIINGKKLLGRVGHCYAQWNRGVSSPLPLPKGQAEVPEIVQMYGSMERFLNWRWFFEYGGGPLSDLGAHQIDLFNWMFDARPKAVLASGGRDYYKEFEHIDNALCIYEYERPEGMMRASYQVLTTNGSLSYYEKFMGDEGTAVIAEDPSTNQVYKEGWVQKSWEPHTLGDNPIVIKDLTKEVVYNKFWEQPKPWTRPSGYMDTKTLVAIGASKAPEQYEMPIVMEKKYHQPHLENFFEAVRKKDPSMVKCNVQEAFETCVIVLKAKEVAENNLGRYVFTPEDFVA
jgi:predicted dehydrogenase